MIGIANDSFKIAVAVNQGCYPTKKGLLMKAQAETGHYAQLGSYFTKEPSKDMITVDVLTGILF